jgi:citronellol/citronellal dehydrogenase
MTPEPDHHVEGQSSAFRSDLLAGRVCVVSGFGTGLGQAAALELARCGAVVIGCGRRPEPLDQTVGLISGLGGTAEAHTLDIRDENAVSKFFDDVVARHGRVDALVNNAGGQFFAPAEEVTPKGLRTVVDVNLVGTWTMTWAAATKSMIPRRSGRIIMITAAPHNGVPGFMATMAARAAVENMTRTLASEWGRFNINVLAVAVGAMASPVLTEKYPGQLVESWEQSAPLGRLGRPAEVASLVAFLASDACAYMTGSVTTVDGGRDNWSGSQQPMREQRTKNPPATTENRRLPV